MDSSQNETPEVSTRLFGGIIEWTHFGHHHHEHRTLALQFSDTLLSDDANWLREVGLGISGIRGVRRAGNSTTCLIIDFADIDISDEDMAKKAQALFDDAESKRPRAPLGIGRRSQPAVAVYSTVD